MAEEPLGDVGPGAPPTIQGHSIDVTMPLHQFVARRMDKNRDVKVLVTAKDSATGTGKTTLAGWCGLSWTPMFASEWWACDRGGTIRPRAYLDQYTDLPKGYALIMDEAEQLDARRSTSSENVDFSHKWMMMRVRQVISILTLPTTSALDKRLMELADVWIEVQRRGLANVHAIHVNSYGSGDVLTPKIHEMTWPDVADHPELQQLHELKQSKIEGRLAEVGEDGEEVPEPDEVERREAIKTVLRAVKPWDDDSGMTQADAEKLVDYSYKWVNNRILEWREGEHRNLIEVPQEVAA